MSEPDDDFEALAGEHVLGLLSAEALARVEHDPHFQAAVRNWTSRLMPLAEVLPPETPPAHIWAGIEAATAPPRPKWRAGAKFWRGFGLGAGVLALAIMVFLAVRPPATPQGVATLATAAQGIFIATATPVAGGMTLIVSPARASVPAGKSAELWLLRPSAKPKPLGLLAAAGPVTMHMPVSSLSGVKLAISLEPQGGSATGLPTGPVIAVADFLRLAASVKGGAS
ncbi:MAG: anti-sigma factor [Betaproteobacteria bacterium]|nr:anti-sigma factor [Betaproteobacteria bacterium]